QQHHGRASRQLRRVNPVPRPRPSLKRRGASAGLRPGDSPAGARSNPDGVYLRLRRDEVCSTLRRLNPLRHLTPNLVGIAGWLPGTKLDDTDRLKTYSIVIAGSSLREPR